MCIRRQLRLLLGGLGGGGPVEGVRVNFLHRFPCYISVGIFRSSASGIERGTVAMVTAGVILKWFRCRFSTDIFSALSLRSGRGYDIIGNSEVIKIVGQRVQTI